ncbi:mannan endo-1,4-beta-mannosidase [Arcticibacter pallidicorallinus]|uniref:Mannan endo-1,4-beta-mannosidase n=1 Tax=Arcticibacter pallidicorallinus TaxID=1259464 RepID=A0A2T0U7R8_9SPHI|nr:glycosyl hydrolase [Arcticibacter pallidicorallinus]PRY53966.1 mannan endo-1,4-beta-mannosidase [Arcticibacter pallidicorallinus]
MIRLTLGKLILALLSLGICRGASAQRLADNKASAETQKLFGNLFRLKDEKILFGHQDALAYGYGWKYEDNRSDIKDITGEHPALYGWDIGGIEHGSQVNIDSVPFSKMKDFIRAAYDRGGVNTISWHLDNPVNGKSSWDTIPGSVEKILPGGEKHSVYNMWLDRVSEFMKDLKGSDGKLVPVLFRPFHELTGTWFWWGKRQCSSEDFKKLWIYTFDYLRSKKGVHNLIYVYNTADFASPEEFLERYPGNKYADVLSFDAYQFGSRENGSAFRKNTEAKMTIIAGLAKTKGKLIALAETGYEAIPDPVWWTEVLYPSISSQSVSFILMWRNAGFRPHNNDYHYYAPYPGHSSVADFLKFIKNERMVLQGEVTTLGLYK